jgi:ubiquitin carboxyl-terminal hydrolase 9/24
MTIVMRGSPAAGDSSVDPQQPGPNPAGTGIPATPVSSLQAVPPLAQPGVPSQQGDESGQGDVNMEHGEDGEPDFPVQELSRLDEMINRPRWVVPVLPNGELEILLNASIKLCKEGKPASLFIYGEIFCWMKTPKNVLLVFISIGCFSVTPIWSVPTFI